MQATSAFIANVAGAVYDVRYAPATMTARDSQRAREGAAHGRHTIHAVGVVGAAHRRARVGAALPPIVDGDAAPFAVQPSCVDFAHARVGQVRTCVVTLVNRTSTTRTVRVTLADGEDDDDAFRVTFAPPSQRVPPGLSCTATVTFAPTTTRACGASAALLARCGDVCWTVPLRAQPAAVQLSCTDDAVDFGLVRVGSGCVTRRVVLRNDGACDAQVRLHGSTLSLVSDGSGALRLTPAATRFVVAAHSTYTLSLSFAPQHIADVDGELHVHEASATTPACSLRVRGRGVAAAVHLLCEELDMALCYADEAYRASVTVVNDGNVVATVTARVPPHLHDVLCVVPPCAVVQAHNSMTVQLHYTPTRAADVACGDDGTEDACVDVCEVLRFDVACAAQAAQPLSLTLRATVMPPALLLSTPEVHCGDVFVGTTCERSVRVRNASRVPQTCGMVTAARHNSDGHDDDDDAVVTLRPRAVTLLPGEAYDMVVCTTPRQSGDAVHALTLIDGRGVRYALRVHVCGVVPPVTLQHRTVLLPPCAAGSSVTATTVLRRCRATDDDGATAAAVSTTFRVSSPMLSVSPSPCGVGEGDSVLVVTFAPTASDVEAAYALWQGNEDDGGLRSWHSTQYVQCVCEGSDAVVCELAVRCVVVQPCLLVAACDGDDVPLSALEQHGSTLHVDFGTVAAGAVARRTCVVRCTAAAACDDVLSSLCVQPCGALSPFAAHLLPQRNDKTAAAAQRLLLLQYAPRAHTGVQCDTVRVATSAAGHEVAVHVRGRCASSDLVVTLDNDDSSAALHFAPVRVGDLLQRVVRVRNASSVAAHVTVDVTEATSQQGAVVVDTLARELARCVFVPQVCALALPPGECAACVVRFAPRDAGTYAAVLRVRASNTQQTVALYGQAHRECTYMTVPTQQQHTAHATMTACYTPPTTMPADSPAVLSLSPGEAQCVVLGAVHNNSSSATVVECTVALCNEGSDASLQSARVDEAGGVTEGVWRAAPARLTLCAGQHDMVTFTRNAVPCVDAHVLRVPACTFALTLRCVSDAAYNHVYYVRCVAS